MWFLPSRGRPHLIERMWKVGMPATRGVLAYDIDQAKDYANVPLPPGWDMIALQRTHLSAKLNRLFEIFGDEEWYGVICDDQVPETPDWDRLLSAEADDWNVAWADDCLNKRIGAAVYGGKLVRTVGWLQCPTIKHFFLDDVWETIVRRLNCGILCNDIKIPHLHFTMGGTPYDTTYSERPNHAEDKEAFNRWKHNDWPELEARLKETMRCSMSAA